MCFNKYIFSQMLDVCIVAALPKLTTFQKLKSSTHIYKSEFFKTRLFIRIFNADKTTVEQMNITLFIV